jgi:microcin C transport system substrate-binding protein
VRDQQLVKAKTGEPYAIEFLSEGSAFERVFLSYKPSLDRLGIATTVRTVDEVQYQNRLRSWDFDIITAAWQVSITPGNELRGYWGSRAAEEPGSLNRVGIKNPAVDAMIDQIVFAKNRADLEAAARALDRILLWNHYVVPQWYYNKVRNRTMGSLRPSRSAEIRHGSFSHCLVVGRPKSRKSRLVCFSRAAGLSARLDLPQGEWQRHS